MAFSTIDLSLKQEDGWVLVATNPAYIHIKPSEDQKWSLAITSGTAPSDSLIGVEMGWNRELPRESYTKDTATTGTVYIRLRNVSASYGVNSPIHFGIIRDQA